MAIFNKSDRREEKYSRSAELYPAPYFEVIPEHLEGKLKQNGNILLISNQYPKGVWFWYPIPGILCKRCGKHYMVLIFALGYKSFNEHWDYAQFFHCSAYPQCTCEGKTTYFDIHKPLDPAGKPLILEVDNEEF